VLPVASYLSPASCQLHAIPPAAARSERVTSSQTLLLLAALLGAGTALSQARAAPLDADTCGKLMVEQGALEKAGIEQEMSKGAEWAKANLGLERLNQVRRFIELEEQILFRCRSKSLVNLPPDPETDPPDKDQDKDKAKQAADGQDKQETIVSKTPPKTAAPPTAAKPKAAAAPDPKQKVPAAKTPAGASTAKAGDPKAQPKVPPKKQDATKAQPPPKQAPKGGTTAAQKSPSKAKADDAGQATDLKQ
jgi:hypothetical protein